MYARMAWLAMTLVAWAYVLSNTALEHRRGVRWISRPRPLADEADESCHILSNNTYLCAPDAWLTRDINFDDSY